MGDANRISVIIPVLNEAQQIQGTIASANAPATEIIVVDGGSTDATVPIAQSQGVTVISSPPGRADQMNAGAKIATGDILVFLHADTRLPQGFEALIFKALNMPTATGEVPIAGAFAVRIDSPQPALRWIERGVNWRSRFFQMPYGDQALFLRTSVFQTMGGFPELPILEDFELVRQLKKRGSIVVIDTPVLTSARRWLQKGIWQTTLINQLVILGYWLGIDTAQLARLYRQQKFWRL
jgi:rSAM/selenodomain-associated transferase 2